MAKQMAIQKEVDFFQLDDLRRNSNARQSQFPALNTPKFTQWQ